MTSNSTFPGIFERDKKCHQELNFVPQHLFANASQLRKQSLRSCCCSLVYLLPSSCTTHSGYHRYYTCLESIFSIWRRSCSTPSMFTCILSTMWLHEIILRKSTRNLRQAELTSHLPTAVLTQAVSNLKNPLEHIFFTSVHENSFGRGKRSSFEKKNYFKSFTRNSESIWMTHLSISF